MGRENQYLLYNVNSFEIKIEISRKIFSAREKRTYYDRKKNTFKMH